MRVAELLDFIESCGDGLSNHQRAYYEKTKERDFLQSLLFCLARESVCRNVSG